MQATTVRRRLPQPEPEGEEGAEGEEGVDSEGNPEAQAFTDGTQSGSAEFHDITPTSPSGNGLQEGDQDPNARALEGMSGGESSGEDVTISMEESSSGSSKEGSKSKSKAPPPPRASDAKVASSSSSSSGSGSPSGTIGGQGTQEEYQEARLRFLNSATGVIVSADTISLDEGQIGSLVTASFDEL